MQRSNEQRSNEQNNEDQISAARATAMRAGIQNRSGSNYQVADPTASINDSNYNQPPTTTTTTTGAAAGDHTLKDTVISGASTAASTAASATKTVAAGAAAAGAATVAAVRHLFADKTAGTTTTATTGDTTTTRSVDSPHPHPIADFPNTAVHNISTQSPNTQSTNDTPTATHAATGPIHSVPVEPLHSTGLDAPKGYKAKEADLHATTGVPATKVDVHPTTTLNQGHNTHHRANSPALPSQAPTHATTPHTTTDSIDSRPTEKVIPMTEKVKAPIVGATSALGATAAGTATYLGNKAMGAKEAVKDTVGNLSSSGAPSNLSSSGAPSNLSAAGTPTSTTSSHATMDSTKGIYVPTHSTHTPTAATPATTTHTTHTSSSAPLSEKVKAPIV
ncbi:hypothetical protein BGX23_001255, partial [Mortierella sp. AD031]